MYSLWQDLSVRTKNFDLVTLTLTFDLLLKKLNLGYTFWTKRDKVFLVQVCIPCGKTFLSIPKILTLWPWPWLSTYFWKNLTLTITFDWVSILHLTFPCDKTSLMIPIFLTLWPWPWLWPTYEKTWIGCRRGGGGPVRTDPDLVGIVSLRVLVVHVKLIS